MDQSLQDLFNNPNSPVGAVYRGSYASDDEFVAARRVFAERLVDRLAPMGINVDVGDKMCVVGWPMQMGGGVSSFVLRPLKSFEGLFDALLLETEARMVVNEIKYAGGEPVDASDLVDLMGEMASVMRWRSVGIEGKAAVAHSAGGRLLSVAIPAHRDAEHVVQHLKELSSTEGDGQGGPPPDIAPPYERVEERRPYTVYDQAYIAERYQRDLLAFTHRMKTRQRIGAIQSFDYTPGMVEVIRADGQPLQFRPAQFESLAHLLDAIDNALE